MTWTKAVVKPAIMLQRRGRGSMPYVTNTMNSTYHTRCSLELNPRLIPIDPVNIWRHHCPGEPSRTDQ